MAVETVEKKQEVAGVFKSRNYTFIKRFFWFLRHDISIYDDSRRLVMFSKTSGAKDIIEVYGNEREQEKILDITAKESGNPGILYEVADAFDGSVIGSINVRAAESFFREEYVIVDNAGREQAVFKQEKTIGAAAGKIIGFLPGNYIIETVSKPVSLVARVKKSLSPMRRRKFSIKVIQPFPSIDIRLIVSAVTVFLTV